MNSTLERDLKSRGLLPEQLMTCPYNKRHQISEGRFYNHFYKCRRNWMAHKALKGEEVHYLTCKYNHYHRVPEVEITHHETTCVDRKKLRFYQVRDAVKQFFPPDYYEEFQKFEKQHEQEELKDLYDGLNAGVLYSEECFGKPVTFEELVGMTSEDVWQRRWEALRKMMPKNWLYKAGRMSKEEYDELVKKEEMEKKAKAEKVALGSDDEDWYATSNGPGFDFWQNIWDPDVRHSSVPGCLSKVERKLFMKIHSRRWEKERLEKLELQRNPRPGTEEYLLNQHREWKSEIEERRLRDPPAPPRALPPLTQITEREEKPNGRGELRVRFETETEEEADQRRSILRGCRGRARTRGGGAARASYGTPPPQTYSVMTKPPPPPPQAYPVERRLSPAPQAYPMEKRLSPTPQSSSMVVAQKWQDQKAEEQCEGAVGGAMALVVQNENIADVMGNYQFDEDEWVQPGYVIRTKDPYWGTGNKTDDYEITVKKVNRVPVNRRRRK